MSNKVIVVVADLDNAAHGEINVLESPDEAAQLVETLIESGYDQARIRAFAADEFQISVYHRPVVALTTADAETTDEPELAGASEEADQEEDAPAVGAELAAALLKAEVAPEPFVRNGVRFSTQFGPA
ncbi:MAG: hypothetical protein DRI30_02000 [Chloroflexi bacterium]|nr:MAG: hypothetical protein DRI30_02000 [Chloroflexota bacterium]